MKRPFLYPLVPLYALAIALKNRAANKKQPSRLQNPVLSIGSISAGGAGKTPVVIALAKLLTSNGHALSVLTRGYGRVSPLEVERITRATDPRHSGDEALLIARETEAEVFVSANRLRAGQLAESELPSPLIHLLDDGFQHRQLHRSLDIVLLTPEDLADTLLPAGNLREPHSSLARANIIVLRQEDAALAPPNKKIWLIRRTLTLDPIPSNPLVFSGIARPENFLSMLAEKSITPAASINFPDHHPYTDSDITTLQRKAEAAQATSFLTTAKDFVKLSPSQLRRLEKIGPVQVAHLEVTFADPAAVLADVKSAITR